MEGLVWNRGYCEERHAKRSERRSKVKSFFRRLRFEVFEQRHLLSADLAGVDAPMWLRNEVTPSGNSVVVWANNGEDKVAREDLRAVSNPAAVTNSVWKGHQIELFGARNETVSFNLVLEAPLSDVAGIEVSFQELIGPAGARIGSVEAVGEQVFDYVDRNIELFFVRYLEIEGLSVSAFDAFPIYDERHIPERFRLPHDENGHPDLSYGWSDRPDHNHNYPEIAVPLELVGDFSIAAGHNQSVWCDVYVPRDVPAGTYTGVVEVSQHGTVIQEVPVQLRVHGFTLPDASSTQMSLFVSRENINARLLGQPYPDPGTPAYASSVDALLQVHKLAHRHRVSLLENYMPLEGMDDYWLSVLSGEAFTAQEGYDGPGQGVGPESYVIGTYGSWPWQDGDCSTMWSELDNWALWFDSHGLDSELFLYIKDEPQEHEAQEVEAWAHCMAQNPGPGSRIKSLATLQLPIAAEDTPSLQVPASTPRVADPQVWEPLAEQYKPLWMYNGRRPYSGSLAIEDDGVSPRTLGWIMHKTDVGHWFLWEGTYWNNFQFGTGPTDVFSQAKTFGGTPYFDQHLGQTSGMYGNGDGVLFYPGTDMTGVGPSYDVAGVFSSLRLKHVRRGLQDAEYLAMAAAIDAASTQQIVNQILPKALWEYGVSNPQDPTWVRTDISWSNDPDVWEQARQELATMIESAVGDEALEDIAGRTADGRWYVAASTGESFDTQYWGLWGAGNWTDVMSGDFNGDGRPDVAGRLGNLWYVGLNTGDSFSTTYWGLWGAGEWTDVLVGDFTGNGRDDIAGRLNDRWYVASSTGSSFQTSYWGIWGPGDWTDVMVGDFSGNGRADIAGRFNNRWYVASSTGSSFQTTYWGLWGAGNWTDVMAGDFNRDGKTDIAGRFNNRWYVASSTGSSFQTTPWGLWGPGAWNDVLVGDFTGDGRADIAGRLDNRWYVASSTGSSFQTTYWGLWGSTMWDDVRVGDFTGDGRHDIAGRLNDGRWFVARSEEDRFQTDYWGLWDSGLTWLDVLVDDFAP